MNTLCLIPMILVLALVFAVLLAVSGFRTGGRLNPNPPEHLRPKTKCICNDIANHSPGGRCEACYSKCSALKMRNPPPPPFATPEAMRLSIENANKANLAVDILLSRFKEPELTSCLKKCGDTLPSKGFLKICLNCGSSLIREK